MTVSADLLTAAGLILATIGLVFSAWYTEMTEATHIAKPRKRADREPQIRTVRSALCSRAVPLLVALIVTVAALLPPAWSVLWHALTDDFGNVYDPVRAIFMGVWLLMIALTCAVTQLVIGLWRKMRALEAPDLPPTGSQSAPTASS